MRSDGSVFLDRIEKKTLERLLSVGTLAVVLAGACIYALGRPPKNSVDMFVALSPDGSSEWQCHTSFMWDGPTTLRDVTFGNSVPLVEDRWTDGAGRLLDVKTEPCLTGGSTRRVRFAEPVFPDERVELKNVSRTLESVVRRDGEDYAYRDIPSWGGNPYALTYTMTLPKGAEVVSTQPETAWRCVVEDREVLHFKWTEKPGHHPELRVKYSLPKG